MKNNSEYRYKARINRNSKIEKQYFDKLQDIVILIQKLTLDQNIDSIRVYDRWTDEFIYILVNGNTEVITFDLKIKE